MTLRDILIFLFKWKGTLIGFTILVTALTALIVYVKPQTYQATASVLVEDNRAPTLRSAFVPGVDSALVMNTETQLLTSRTVLASVVDSLNLHGRPGKPPGAVKRFVLAINAKLLELGLIGASGPRESAIEALGQSITVDPVIKSNVMSVSYEDQDPEWAAKITNALVDAYIQHHWKVYSAAGSSERFLDQLNEAREALEALRRESDDFKQQVLAPAIPETQRALVQQLATFREQRSDYDLQLSEQRARYEDDHPDVIQLRRNVAQLLKQEAAIEKQLLELERSAARVNALTADIRAAEDYYLNFKRQFEEAQLDERSSIDLINVRVSDRAAVPAQPTYSRLFLIEAAFVAALLIAFSLAITREYFDRRVTSAEIAEEILGIRDLGSIEDFGIVTTRLHRLLDAVRGRHRT